ncbi:MAG: helix-turn-helix transcriptional regulator [Bacteroidales bacterium]|nr:helix-turn-helix transcriptional regulator [Bacteroidales bacterium]
MKNINKMENTIRVERAIKRMTQADLAERIGTTRQTIHNIEAGKFTPSVDLALKIARYFGKQVEDIFKLEEND